jgi:hypothetical protein
MPVHWHTACPASDPVQIASMASAAILEMSVDERQGAPARRQAWPRLRLHDFPIPDQVEADADWTPQMKEIASATGDRAALLLCEAFGGQTIYLPRRSGSGEHSLMIGRLRSIVGDDAAARLLDALGGRHVTMPRARTAIVRARRAGVIAHARAGTLSIATMAAILGVTRNYAGYLVNHTQEGVGIAPAALPVPRDQRLLMDAAAAAARRLGAAGVRQDLIDDVSSGILSFSEKENAKCLSM